MKLRSLFFKTHDQAGDDSVSAAAVQQLTEKAVEHFDKRIRIQSSYRRQLRRPVTTVLEHLDSIVAALPEPFSCSQNAFTSDPRLRSMFSAQNHIHEALHDGDTLPAFFRDLRHGSAEECHALMRVVRHEKNTFGTGMQGDMIVREIAQVSVNFRDHLFITPQPDAKEEKIAIRDYLFEQFLSYAHRERARVKVDALHEKTITSDLLISQSLSLLAEILDKADNLVTLDNIPIAVDHMGIKQENPEQSKHCLQFILPEVKVGDASSVGLFPVRIQRKDIDPHFARKQADKAMNQMLYI